MLHKMYRDRQHNKYIISTLLNGIKMFITISSILIILSTPFYTDISIVYISIILFFLFHSDGKQQQGLFNKRAVKSAHFFNT